MFKKGRWKAVGFDYPQPGQFYLDENGLLKYWKEERVLVEGKEKAVIMEHSSVPNLIAVDVLQKGQTFFCWESGMSFCESDILVGKGPFIVQKKYSFELADCYTWIQRVTGLVFVYEEKPEKGSMDGVYVGDSAHYSDLRECEPQELLI